jgi:cbb3-type cytochrome oxidase subunit 3
MTGDQSYHLLYTFLTLVFAICVLGLVCWVYVDLKKGLLSGARASLIALVGALVLGGALWSTSYKVQASVPKPTGTSPANDNPIQNPVPTPTPATHTVKKLIGKDFEFPVGGCQSLGRVFTATAAGDLNRSGNHGRE